MPCLRSAKRWLLLFAVVAVTVAVDQLTKHIVSASMSLGETKSGLGPLKLIYITNGGVAYGLLANHLPLVIVFTTAVVIWFGIYFARNPHQQKLFTVGVGLLIGGAGSNLGDRIFSGHVTDFLKLPFTEVFNVADLALFAGIIVLLINSLRPTRLDDHGARARATVTRDDRDATD